MIDKKTATDAALRGLDFLVRHQVSGEHNANYGRFVSEFDFAKLETKAYASNWMVGVCIEAMLAGHRFTGNQIYLDAAERAAKYLTSLQFFGPNNKRMYGIIREETPQTSWAHTRDALTASWAMLDYSMHSGKEEYFERSIAYADWFLNVGIEKGYPYWTVRLDDNPWLPKWSGSFQSGGAFYFYRLFSITGELKYKDAMFQILDHYNKYHLEKDGRIYVAVDMETKKPIKAYEVNPKYSNVGWETMHEYNDDFGALANLAAYKISKRGEYLNAAKCFLSRMLLIQREDGGFGPVEYSVPNAGGTVLLELLAAESFDLKLASNEQIERIVRYILSLQINDPDSPANGAFRGFNSLCRIVNGSNARVVAYSIMGLLRYAGAVDSYYFFERQPACEYRQVNIDSKVSNNVSMVRKSNV